MLLHQNKLHRFETMEIIHSRSGISNTRYAAQSKKGLPGEIVRSKDIMVHNCERDHCSRGSALFQRDAKLEALIKDGVESLFVDVCLLLIAMLEDAVW